MSSRPWFFILAALLLGVGLGFGVGWLTKPHPNEILFNPHLSGLIDIRPELKKRLRSTDVLFIILTRPGESMPLAVKRVRSVHFPFLYTVGPEDRMLPGSVFEGPVNLSVRVDKDGQAGPPSPGDLVGKPRGGPFSIPAEDLHVLIDQLVE